MWARVEELWLAERERWPLWLPVALAIGAGLYFELSVEPPWHLASAAAAVALLAAWFGRCHPLAGPGLAMLAGVFVGLAAGAVNTRLTATPMLESRLGPTIVTGRVLTLDAVRDGHRMVLDRLELAPRPHAETLPAAIRVTLREPPAPDLAPGALVRFTGILRPVPVPAVPDGFDYPRHLYFQGVGAIATVLGPIEILGDAASGWRLAFSRLRTEMSARIRAVLPGDTGAVAAALITGDRSLISDDLERAMRDSGLTHLLSISGLHIAIVAGFVFLVLRGGLALWPWVALRVDIKKAAAAVALIVVFLYAQLAGWTIPTQRSFAMSALVLVAIMLDRNPFSLRVAAAAACVVLVTAPDAVTGPSFQMSFAAVVELLAVWEASAERVALWRADRGPVGRGLLWVGGVVASSVVATLATAPFTAFHFNRVALFSVLANVVAVPISTLPVMPAGLLAALLMPFGLEAWALIPMGWGIAVIDHVARAVAGWPGAVLLVPSFPVAALAALALAGCWLALWRRPWRWAALAPMLATLIVVCMAPVPDLLIAADGQRVALRDRLNGVEFWPTGRPDRVGGWWLARWGEPEVGDGAPTMTAAQTAPRCEDRRCVAHLEGWRITYQRDPAGLTEACRQPGILVTPITLRRPCLEPGLVVDRARLARDGALAISIDADRRLTVRTVREARGQRPWVVAASAPPPQYRRTSPTNRP
jgi:competence protein ComEC